MKTNHTDKTFSETEERIFSAALATFAEHGKGGARMQDIADRAGINKALVHYYFRSKDRLYEEVFRYIFARYFTLIGRALEDQGDFRDMLRTFITRYIELIEGNRNIVLFLLREISSGAPVLPSLVRDSLAHMPANPVIVFMQRYQHAVARGEIRSMDPVQLFISIMGACIFYFISFPITSALIPGLVERRDQFIEERKAHIFDLVYHGLSMETHP